LEGEKTIRIFGEEIPVNCRVREVHGLSAHADQTELIRWLSTIKKSPKFTFVTHGELESATAFSSLIETQLKWKTMIPDYLQSMTLFEGI
jgi:metallo-beta-lactamase family protein